MSGERDRLPRALTAVCLWAGLGLTVVAAACDLTGGDGADVEPVEAVRIAVEESWPEPEAPSDPVLSMRLESVRDFRCLNYELVADHRIEGDHVRVVLEGAVAPRTCLTALGPARTGFPIDLEPDTYALSLVRAGRPGRDRYELVVRDTIVQLEPVDSTFSRPFFRYFWRTPERSMAVYCRRGDASDAPCTGYLDTLRHRPAWQRLSPPPYAELIYGRSADSLGVPRPPTLFRYEKGGFDEAKRLLETYVRGLDAPARAGIMIVNWRGVRIRSEQLRETSPEKGQPVVLARRAVAAPTYMLDIVL